MTCFPPETSFKFIWRSPPLRGCTYELYKKSGLLVRCMHRDKAQDSQMLFDDSTDYVVWFSLPGSPPYGVVYLLKFLHIGWIKPCGWTPLSAVGKRMILFEFPRNEKRKKPPINSDKNPGSSKKTPWTTPLCVVVLGKIVRCSSKASPRVVIVGS